MTSVRDSPDADNPDADSPDADNPDAHRPGPADAPEPGVPGATPLGSDRGRHRPGEAAIPAILTGAAWLALGVASFGSAATDAPHSHVITTALGLLTITLMTVAMMGPLTIPGVRAVASASTGQRHGFVTTSFCAAFLGVWTVIAICLQPVAATVTGVLGSAPAGAAVLLALCAAGQFDPRRGDRAARCGKPPKAAAGVPARLAAARCGWSAAIGDVRFCALPMLAMLALPGSLAAMAAITTLTVLDRATVGRYRWGVAAGYICLAAALLLT